MSEPGSSSSTGSTDPAQPRQGGDDGLSTPAASDDPLSPRPSPHPPRLGVELLLETPAAADIDPPLDPWLAEQLARLAALSALPGSEQGSVTLVVVDDPHMAALHERYFGDPTTTDVISFDLRDAGDAPLEGDLVLCLDEAQRQAQTRRHDVRMELLLYAVHGLLHLLGYDDHDPAEAERMHRLEDELLVRGGFNAVYGDNTPTENKSAKQQE
ncbi:MAG: rRNA maturation RNase YbeY [bacterium]